MKGRAIKYSNAELRWIEANASLPAPDLHHAFTATFGRNVSQNNLVALRKRNGWRTGRTGRFVKGQTPHNTGVKGYCPPGSEKGWFRAGERRGVAVKLYQPIGTERVSKDGYIERKIHDGMPLQSRWRAVHLLAWEEINGCLPAGMALKCVDGDKSNTNPKNWVLIPRALLPRLNGKYGRNYDAAPSPIKPTILATARLEHAIRTARKGSGS